MDGGRGGEDGGCRAWWVGLAGWRLIDDKGSGDHRHQLLAPRRLARNIRQSSPVRTPLQRAAKGCKRSRGRGIEREPMKK